MPNLKKNWWKKNEKYVIFYIGLGGGIALETIAFGSLEKIPISLVAIVFGSLMIWFAGKVE